jgi:hypothetical protein
LTQKECKQDKNVASPTSTSQAKITNIDNFSKRPQMTVSIKPVLIQTLSMTNSKTGLALTSTW